MADVSKVIINGNTVFDLTGVTVTPDKLAEGVIAHDKSGKKIVGTAEKTSAEPAKTYQIEECGAEGYDSGIGYIYTDSSLYASTDEYCGYIKNTEESVILKSKSSLIIMLNFGLKHGYKTERKNSDGNKTTYSHYFVYRDDTWYKVAKFPAGVLSHDIDLQFYNLYNLTSDNTMSKYYVKIATDGTIYIKFDGEYESNETYFLGGFAVYGS